MLADEISEAKKRWEASPHGPMLERILPPTFDAARLPERQSNGQAGGGLLRAVPQRAKSGDAPCREVAERRAAHGAAHGGQGQHGHADGRDDGRSESARAEDTRAIIAYLQRYAQKPLDPARYPEVNQPSGEAFRLACNQCHVLPDPKRYTAAEWPRVVAHAGEHGVDEPRGRLEAVPGEPRLALEEINAFLARHARKPGG